MDGESKEQMGFNFPQSKLQIASMGRRKSGGAAMKSVLGFEPTVIDYI
jgi:hypothetical protein